MAKSQLNLKARKLRRSGVSINQISLKLDVSKGSVSWWVRDIILTEAQLTKLKASEEKGRALGRLKTTQIKRDKRLKFLEEFDQAGTNKLSLLTENELFVAGLALYWAEGGKSFRNRRVEFCNSDPMMIKFILIWFERCFKVSKQDLKCVVGINQIHSSREVAVKKYWSDLTGIPLSQFRKTSFKKVVNNKVYENFDDHYGTLSVLVARSARLYYQIMGLIKGLTKSEIMAA